MDKQLNVNFYATGYLYILRIVDLLKLDISVPPESINTPYNKDYRKCSDPEHIDKQLVEVVHVGTGF